MKNKDEHGNFNNVLFFMSLKHAQLWKKCQIQKPYEWGQNTWYKICVDTIAIGVQSADIVVEKKD